MKITAVYPGTFDPITNGHSDIVQRAAELFDKVVVAIAVRTQKATAFSVDERVAMAARVLEPFGNVEVVRFDCLVIELARRYGAKVLIRGLRAVSDFDYEFQMAGMNRKLYPQAQTVFLTPAEQYSFLSSSLVREIAMHGGDISEFVHPVVQAALRERLQRNPG
jgi:pantetheine-phosphate adenylyltransferase